MFYYPPDVVVEVQTNLNTSLFICPWRNQTILEIKGIVEGLHVKWFPQHGEIHVVKVKALMQGEKVTVRNGDVIGTLFTEWDGKIIIKADKRKSDASHATGPNAYDRKVLQSSPQQGLCGPSAEIERSRKDGETSQVLPSSSQKEIAFEYDCSHAMGLDRNMSDPQILVRNLGEDDPSHGMGPDPNIFYQEILPCGSSKRSKPSTETANLSKPCEIVRLPNSSRKTEDGNDAFHATDPNFHDRHILQMSPLRRSASSTEIQDFPKALESTFFPSRLQETVPTSFPLVGNCKMLRPSTDNKNSPKAYATPHIASSSQKNVREIVPKSSSLVKLSSRSSRGTKNSPKACATCGSLVRNSTPSSRPSLEAKNSPKFCDASLLPSNLQKNMPKSPSIIPNLKRSLPTKICVTEPEKPINRAEMRKAFWDFWEIVKQRRLKMVPSAPNHPMKAPRGPKRRAIGPKKQIPTGVFGKP